MAESRQAQHAHIKVEYTYTLSSKRKKKKKTLREGKIYAFVTKAVFEWVNVRVLNSAETSVR